MKQSETAPLPSIGAFWEQLIDSPVVRDAAKKVISGWLGDGYRRRLGPNHVVLEAPGPAKSGIRTAVAIYSDGRVLVPFSSYAGQNSGIAIEALTSEAFRLTANALFGFDGSERQARTAPGWLLPERAEPLLEFCRQVAQAYALARGVEAALTQDRPTADTAEAP